MPVADDSLSATSTVPPRPASGRPASGRPKEAFVLLAAVQVVLVLAITMLSVALPTIRVELGLSIAQLTLVSAAYGLSFGGLLLLGRLTEDSAYAGPVLAGLVLLPAGIALVFSAATITLLDDVPAEQSGLAGGVVNTALETGPTAGLAVLASLAASHTAGRTGGATARTAAEASGYAFAFTTAGVIFAVSVLAAVLLLRGRSRIAP
ncbi:hypothetical protein [Streptomyces cyaneofuscatus]|uniref:hypothetical protein n=1 Tax=Streptomyces cyaneofuscatus TaxID=66883 RepID=UPI00343464FB